MLVECVPNFSEGRDAARIERLAAAASSVSGAALLDRHSDPDHHRTVLTLAGSPEAVAEAVFRAARVAVDEIDLREHRGVHPRIGAVDVVPFVPLQGANLERCQQVAQAFARRLVEELEVPVYYYARSARAPERVRLPWLRRPEFEGLADALASAERAPDLGPAAPHPTAGATAVGVRDLLVAFNVDLETNDLKLARRIARSIRASSGGLAGVQARGLHLEEQGRVQVSTNLLDVTRAGPGRVHRKIAELAGEAGVTVGSAELVGLMPRAGLVEAGEQLLGLPSPPAVLEDRLEERLVDPHLPLPRYLEHLAGARHDDPGGGSAAAIALALGRACLEKVVALTRGGKGALDDATLDGLLANVRPSAELLDLGRRDHAAFAALMNAFRLPRGPERKEAIRASRGPAVSVPEEALAAAVALAEAAARLAAHGNPNLRNDALAAAELALASGRVATLNARANRPKKAPRDDSALIDRLQAAAQRAREACG